MRAAPGPYGAVARLALTMLLVAGIAGCESDAYDVEPDLSYDPTIDIYGTFDYYEPKLDRDRTDRPAVIAIHGGAWRTGDKAWGDEIAAELCPLGYVVFSVNYRLSSRTDGTWPAQIEDVRNAVGGPVRHRNRKRFLRRVLGQIEVAEQADERRNDPPPLRTVDGVEGGRDVGGHDP